MAEIPYVRQPIEFPARYAHGPDSFVRPGVPRGVLHEYAWDKSRVFPETHRRYWVYVPVQYTPSEPASLMVFQDAEWYMDIDFEVRAPIVLDNLIHRGEMPVTIVVFVESSENRNAEYDAFSDAYATFLLEEIVPAVRADYAITDDPDHWAVAGGSSGGNCAFTVAWFRPDRFRRVFCSSSSFVQMPDGNPIPSSSVTRHRSACGSCCTRRRATSTGTSRSTTGSAQTCRSPRRSLNVGTTSG